MNKLDKIEVVVKIFGPQEVVCCPLPSMEVWSLHPRVYLQLDMHQEARCPYCSTLYVVENE